MINLVVSCTKRKRFINDISPTVRSLFSETLKSKQAQWIATLNLLQPKAVPAKDIYIGDHWSVARSLVDDQNRIEKKINLWVCSAGYGLISADSKIVPYHATFMKNSDDSVAKGDSQDAFRKNNQLWWNRLSKWEGPTPGQPRSIAELAGTFPKSPLMVVGSRDYIEALYPDLQEALEHLFDPDFLMIISTELRDFAGLNRHIIPCDSRMQQLLGGALVSINIRMAKKIIEENEYDDLKAHIMVEKYRHLLNSLPTLSQRKRIISGNDTVKEFIMHSLKLNSNCTHSKLLRRYREKGFACEQSRFRKLFLEVREAQLDIF